MQKAARWPSGSSISQKLLESCVEASLGETLNPRVSPIHPAWMFNKAAVRMCELQLLHKHQPMHHPSSHETDSAERQGFLPDASQWVHPVIISFECFESLAWIYMEYKWNTQELLGLPPDAPPPCPVAALLLSPALHLKLAAVWKEGPDVCTQRRVIWKMIVSDMETAAALMMWVVHTLISASFHLFGWIISRVCAHGWRACHLLWSISCSSVNTGVCVDGDVCAR